MSENVHFRSTTRHMLRESQSYVNQTLMGGLSGFESPIGLDRRDRINALKSGDIGFVHSWDINTSVDGPGTRMTVFMSGCPLRCQYCQNPDTWKMRDGKPVYYEAMVKKIERYADLFKATHGGITFSGGESMMQPAFVSRVFHAAKEMGVHTCLDTSGFLGASYTDDMVDDIDLCLLDVKSGDEETYKKVTGGILQRQSISDNDWPKQARRSGCVLYSYQGSPRPRKTLRTWRRSANRSATPWNISTCSDSTSWAAQNGICSTFLTRWKIRKGRPRQ